MSVKITCVNKDSGDHYDPYLAITNLGWVNEQSGEKGKSTLSGMVKWIEGGGVAYTKDAYNKVAYLVVRTSRYGNKYVRTVADGRDTNNLLELSECPL